VLVPIPILPDTGSKTNFSGLVKTEDIEAFVVVENVG
jgi:hypothetical protein